MLWILVYGVLFVSVEDLRAYEALITLRGDCIFFGQQPATHAIQTGVMRSFSHCLSLL